MTVYVVGAGISGLVTADRLVRLGHQVVIFEKESWIGGACASFSWHGIPGIDLGPHIWHTPNEELADLWEERFGDLLEQGKFFGKNVIDRDNPTFFDYPVSMQAVEGLPEKLRDRILLELADRSEQKRVLANSFASYVQALVGPTLARMFFLDYPEKLWGIPVETMSADWAPKRIRLTAATEDFHAGQWCAVGVRGSGAITDRIAEDIREKGGQISLETEVLKVQAEGGLIQSLRLRHAGSGSSREYDLQIQPADVVISTAPLPLVARWLNVPNELKYRGAHLVFLYIARSEVIPGEASFLYFGDKETIFHRLSEQKKFNARQFPTSATVLTAEIAFSPESGSQLETQDLASRVIKDLTSWQLIEEDDVLGAHVVSLPYVYPVLTQVSRMESSRVLGELNSLRQLRLIGTGGEFHYADVQILFQKGMELADRIDREIRSPAIGPGEEPTVRREEPLHDFEALISESTSPFIIAEIGLNHGGSVEVAKDMLTRLSELGLTLAKFQTFSANSRVSSRMGASRYAETVQGMEEETNEMFNRCRFSTDEWAEVFDYGAKLGLAVFSTPFDVDSLSLLESLGCPFYKVASMDVNNYPLLAEIAKTGKGIVLSTGMSSLTDIERAVSVIESGGNSKLVLLHCVSQYPASLVDLNLRAMDTLRSAFGYPVGFSDHSVGIMAATVALSLGAAGIERHYTLNRHMEGPDHLASSGDEDFAQLLSAATVIPKMLGSSRVRVTGGERENAYLFKKSVHARTDLHAGSKLTRENLVIKAPYAGIDPFEYSNLLGRELRAAVQADDPITWDLF